MTEETYGQLNGPNMGIIMKELLRRAMEIIWQEQFTFEITTKVGYDGKEDLRSTADTKAQESYIETLTENFPGYGIIAEEHNFQRACTIEGVDLYVTVDPLDGTRAYKRRQSHGIGSMIAIVRNGSVIAAGVGDVMTQELYYYRPGSSKVHRLSKFNIPRELLIDPNLPLRHQNLMLRERPQEFPQLLQDSVINTSLFKEWETTSGSIGVSMARLWKGEVGGFLLAAGHVTPWDETPIVGISKKMGFAFFRITTQSDQLGFSAPGYRATPEACPPQKIVFERDYPLLVVHTSRIGELIESGFKIC